MKTLKDWMKYLEDQARAAELKKKKIVKEEKEAKVEKPRGALDSELASGMERQGIEPIKQVEERKVIAPVRPQIELEQPPTAEPKISEPASPTVKPAEVEKKPPKARREMTKRLALDLDKIAAVRQIFLPLESREESEPKSFKETREELLQKLLDPQLNLREVALLLNVCPTTVRRYTNRGVLSSFRTAGNQRRFRLSDVLEFMEKHLRKKNQ